MPLFDYRCPQDGYKEEVLMSYERTKTCEVICPDCGNAMVKMMSMPAKTATAWNGGWTEGMSHTYYSQALGRKVANRREEEKILNAQGFVAETDLGEGWIEKKQAEVRERSAEQDRRAEVYQTTLAETGDQNKAMVKAFPASDCLDGTLDSLYDQKITI
jgi:hypothetical protein